MNEETNLKGQVRIMLTEIAKENEKNARKIHELAKVYASQGKGEAARMLMEASGKCAEAEGCLKWVIRLAGEQE